MEGYSSMNWPPMLIKEQYSAWIVIIICMMKSLLSLEDHGYWLG